MAMSEGIIILIAVLGTVTIISLAGEFFYWLRTRDAYRAQFQNNENKEKEND